jgi:hypothetical protein
MVGRARKGGAAVEVLLDELAVLDARLAAATRSGGDGARVRATTGAAVARPVSLPPVRQRSWSAEGGASLKRLRTNLSSAVDHRVRALRNEIKLPLSRSSGCCLPCVLSLCSLVRTVFLALVAWQLLSQQLSRPDLSLEERHQQELEQRSLSFEQLPQQLLPPGLESVARLGDSVAESISRIGELLSGSPSQLLGAVAGEEVARAWGLARAALDAAMLHFDDIPMPPLHKLVRVLLAHNSYTRKHRAESKNVLREWAKEIGQGVARPADRGVLGELHGWAVFANLAYDKPEVIRRACHKRGFRLVSLPEAQASYSQPIFFVAYNPQRKVVLISVRGTFSLSDMMTDVIHTPVPFLEELTCGSGSGERASSPSTAGVDAACDAGEPEDAAADPPGTAELAAIYAHKGMAEAARFVVNRSEPLLRELFLPQGYQVHLVGHSLAGGTVTLAAALLRFEKGINATCTAFAPPPTLDGRAARKSLHLEDFVDVVVLGDDVVPRFNFPVLAASAAVLHEFVQQSEQLGMTPDEFYHTHSFEEKLAAIKDQVDKISRRNGLHRDMHLAGRIYFFVKTEDDGHVWREVQSDFPALRRFDGLSLDLVRDHLMDNYESMLHAIINKQDGKRRRRTLALLRYERSVFAPGASRLSAHGPMCTNSLERDGPLPLVDDLSLFSSIF